MKKHLLKVLVMIFVGCIFLFVFSGCVSKNVDSKDNQKIEHVCKYDKQVIKENYRAKKATCVESAKYYFTCECGKIGVDTFVFGEELGHEFTEYIYDENATCEEDGTETAICNRENCNEIDTRTVANSALGHEFTEYIYDENATCKEDGTKTAICDRKNCFETETVSYPNTMLTECVADYSGFCIYCDSPILPTEGIIYGVSTDGTYAEVLGYDGKSEKINIAEKYLGKPVEIVYQSAFAEQNIEKVIFSDNIRTIGQDAFYRCENLKTIKFGENLYSIGEGAFRHCRSLEEITIPSSVNLVKQHAFLGCTKLKKLIIENGVKQVEDGAFTSCGKLTDIEIYSAEINISSYAFTYSNNIIYNINNNLKYLGNSQNLYLILIDVDKDYLEEYVVHENTVNIAAYAFYQCPKLKKVVISDKVEFIGKDCFNQNITPFEIYYKGSLNEWIAINKNERWDYESPDYTIICEKG